MPQSHDVLTIVALDRAQERNGSPATRAAGVAVKPMGKRKGSGASHEYAFVPFSGRVIGRSGDTPSQVVFKSPAATAGKARSRSATGSLFPKQWDHVLGAVSDDTFEPIDPTRLRAMDLLREAKSPTLAELVVHAGWLTPEELYALVVPERTFRERRRHGKPLTADELDRLLRVLRVIEQAINVFESQEKAYRWLRAPKRRLDGRSPMQVLDSDAGATEIGQWLERIEYGIAA